MSERNVAIEFRVAEGRYERLPAMAPRLVRHPVRRHFRASPPAPGGEGRHVDDRRSSSRAAATPVKSGLVASLGRPGGNVTGVTMLVSSLVASGSAIARADAQGDDPGLLVNPTNQNAEPTRRKWTTRRRRSGCASMCSQATTKAEIEAAFATLLAQRRRRWSSAPTRSFLGQADLLVSRGPPRRAGRLFGAIFPISAGCSAQGTSLTEMHRQAGVYTGRILRVPSQATCPSTRRASSSWS
jgi:putative ABC transport system substrate-binding protein